MTHQTACVALWGGLGSKALLQDLHGEPLLRRTLKRLGASGMGKAYILVPWLEGHDALAEQAKAWTSVVRSHPEERVAMRDLVAQMRADIGILVQGHAADVDAAEVRLAYWRCCHGYEDYKSPRVVALPVQRWLSVMDSEEGWGAAVPALEDLRRLYSAKDLEQDTRLLRARRER